jgi:hypothetical protein
VGRLRGCFGPHSATVLAITGNTSDDFSGDQWEISRRYAMFATPIAYLIDEAGIIARDVAVGVEPILALMAKAKATGMKRVPPRTEKAGRDNVSGQSVVSCQWSRPGQSDPYLPLNTDDEQLSPRQLAGARLSRPQRQQNSKASSSSCATPFARAAAGTAALRFGCGCAALARWHRTKTNMLVLIMATSF